MDATELKRRTKQFALDIIFLVQELPRSLVCDVIGKQLLRALVSSKLTTRRRFLK